MTAPLVRIGGRVLMIAQAGLFLLCIYGIIDAYVTPYQSEWLTADAFVPYFILLAFLCVLCFYLTNVIIRSKHRLVWLWLIPIGVITLLPMLGYFVDVLSLG